jgi:hypothetical protein
MNLLLLIITFASSFVFACPNLAANYSSCISSSGDSSNSTDVVVSQKLENGMMIYTIKAKDSQSGEEETTVMIADGKTRKIEETDPDTGMVFVQKETYTCNNQILVGKMTLQIDNEVMLDVSMTTKKVGSQMISEIKGTSAGVTINDLVTCK